MTGRAFARLAAMSAMAIAASAFAAAELRIGGPAIDFAATHAGEVVRLDFAADAGQGVTVVIDPLKHAPDIHARNSTVAILKADGSRLASEACLTRPLLPNHLLTPCKASAFDLPAAGNYTVAMTSPAGALASGRMRLMEVVKGTLKPGVPAKLGPMQPGQLARFVFQGWGGRKVGAQLTGVSTVPAASWVNVAVRPIEEGIFNATRAAAGSAVTVPPTRLPSTSLYSVTVDPGRASLESAILSLSEE